MEKILFRIQCPSLKSENVTKKKPEPKYIYINTLYNLHYDIPVCFIMPACINYIFTLCHCFKTDFEKST